jgi:hypothetical protein
MKRSLNLIPAAILAVAAAPAQADNFYEVESARANARAGGTINDRDAELLDRYGATTGAGNWRARTDGFHDYISRAPRGERYRYRRYYRD